MPDAMIHYTDTAYTAAQKDKLDPPNPELWTGAQRHFRAIPLPNGIHLGDYRSHVDYSYLRELQKGTLPIANLERLRLCSGWSPLFLVILLRKMAGFISLMGLLPIAIYLFHGQIRFVAFYYFLGGGITFLFFHLLSKVVPGTDKNDITMNRATGIVSFPRRGKKPAQELPFAEFDGYTRSMAYPTGVIRYFLHVCHRYQPIEVMPMDATVDETLVFSQWEQLQQIMDVNLPLPDIPEFEPVRHLDPTTKAWDEEHGRDPNYWKNFDEDKIKDVLGDGIEAREAFKWNLLPVDHVPPEALAKSARMARFFR